MSSTGTLCEKIRKVAAIFFFHLRYDRVDHRECVVRMLSAHGQLGKCRLLFTVGRKFEVVTGNVSPNNSVLVMSAETTLRLPTLG